MIKLETKDMVVLNDETIRMGKGKSISEVVYSGTSLVELKSVHNYLSRNYKNNTPIPIQGTDLRLSINNLYTTYTHEGKDTIYKIKVKGELL